MTDIHGECHPDFVGVRDQFASNFDQGLELGASVAATLHGETVVDLWAGDADRGLSGWEPAITPDDLYDWDKVCSALAAQAPWWEPGTMSAYHALTQGFLEGEIVRRVTGRTIGTFFREEVAEQLGADFHIGLPESEEGRVAETVPPSTGMEGVQADPESLQARTLLSCRLTGAEANTRAWRAAEIPAAGGTGNARSIARVHAVGATRPPPGWGPSPSATAGPLLVL